MLIKQILFLLLYYYFSWREIGARLISLLLIELVNYCQTVSVHTHRY